MKQPKLETRVKSLIEVDGFQFKDLNGNGKLDAYEDWRLDPETRAKDLVEQMNIDEKIGMMLINTRLMGKSQKNPELTSHDGILNEEEIEQGTSIFAQTKIFGTTETIENMHLRHFILRDNWQPKDTATWVNTMNEVCEGTRLGIPCIIASNSRNENAEPVFGMNDAVGIFSTWPGTLGLAAAAKGDIVDGGDASLIDEFSETARREWHATGLRKGYMYMCDVVTDPRWQRIYGTFGEDPEFITDVIGRIIHGFQGDELGPDSVAMTTKHFPGGGARDNGFDPHYKEGKWNCYPTEGSLEKYHLPPFVEAAKRQSSSIMPYYSAPSIDKSVVQTYEGEEIPFEEVGIAFNHYFIQDMLRDKMGFKGYINSDSGIVNNMCWGVEDKTIAARFAKAINTGTDIVADSSDIFNLKAAYENGWITEKRIDEANVRLLKELFVLGLFDEKTYVDPDGATAAVQQPEGWEKAQNAHRKSVTLLKNTDNLLPLSKEAMAGKKVYIETFHQEAEKAIPNTVKAKAACDEIGAYVQTEDYNEADVAFLFLYPKSGAYFSATPGYLELSLCENKPLKATDGTPYNETTLADLDRVKAIADAVHANGGKVVISLNFVLPWLVGNIEPLADAFVAGYDTFYNAQFDVFCGNYNPVGVLPLTLPASEDVIAVDEAGNCISRNDVPGYDKDKYLPEGMTYAYVDSDGNAYRLDYGLRY